MSKRALQFLALSACLVAPSLAQMTVTHHSGFQTPVGMYLVDRSAIGSGFVVAEAGTGINDGRVTFLDSVTANRQILAVGLPSVNSVGFPSGPHDVALSGNDLYVALGASLDATLSSTVVRFDLAATPWSPGQPPLTVADIAEVIPVQAFMQSQGYAFSNVYSMALGRKNHLYISDAGANSILRYDLGTKGMSIFADIPAEANPTLVGPPQIDAVPTRIRWDGRYLRVSTMTGFPFVPGLAKVYRIDSQGTVSVEQDNLTLATSFSYSPTTDKLNVTQFADSFDPATGFAPNTGSLVEFNGMGQPLPLSESVAFPTEVVHMADGKPFFTAIGTGDLLRIDPGAMNFCSTTANSVGSGAIMSHAGSVSVAANDLALRCDYVPSDQFGIFFYGSARAFVPVGGGFRCVGGPKVYRLPVIKSTSSGIAFYQMDNSSPRKGGAILPGSIWQFQYWYRDAAGPGGNNLSDGLQILFAD